jgi:signal transduction histidine kinase
VGRSSIRARLTLLFALAISALVLITSWLLITITGYKATERTQDLLHSAARLGAITLGQGGDWQGKLVQLSELPRFREEDIVLAVFDRPPHVMWQSRPTAEPLFHRPGWLVAGSHAGNTLVIATCSNYHTVQAADRQKLDLEIVSLIVILVVAAGSWQLVGWTLSPILRLSHQAQAASADDLRVRLTPPSPDTEIVDLVATLNGLLGRLAETAESRGRFYAAASHELRTPLTALGGHLELALSRERTSEAYREALVEAHEQAKRLSRLVADLLLLTRIDSEGVVQARPGSEEVNFSDISESSLKQLKSLSSAHKVKIKSELADGCVTMANPSYASVLVRNLLENAIKYARPGGTVSVKCRMNGNSTELTVYNECDPIQNLDAEKLFEAFYRPDASRQSQTGGNGLGLAICKAIATLYSWKISVEQVDGGVLARVQL